MREPHSVPGSEPHLGRRAEWALQPEGSRPEGRQAVPGEFPAQGYRDGQAGTDASWVDPPAQGARPGAPVCREQARPGEWGERTARAAQPSGRAAARWRGAAREREEPRVRGPQPGVQATVRRPVHRVLSARGARPGAGEDAPGLRPRGRAHVVPALVPALVPAPGEPDRHGDGAGRRPSVRRHRPAEPAWAAPARR